MADISYDADIYELVADLQAEVVRLSRENDSRRRQIGQLEQRLTVAERNLTALSRRTRNDRRY